MPPLSFFKPGSGSSAGERGGSSIPRPSISRPRALSDDGLDLPEYSHSSSFSDLPVFALERPSTPQQSHTMATSSGVGLARSASASGSSINHGHGSPGRYNPARLLRRKASRRGEREEVWGEVSHPFNTTGSANVSTLPPGAAPPIIHNPATQAETGPESIAGPTLTLSPPGRPTPLRGATPSTSPDGYGTESRRSRGHVPRAHSGGGIPAPPTAMTNNVSKFGSTRSARSTRSIHSEGETEAVYVYRGSRSQSRPSRPALASAFDPPSASAPSSAHPFLAQIGSQVSNPIASNSASTSPSGSATDAPWPRPTPLSPPRRTGRSNPPPARLHSQGSQASIALSSHASRGSIDSVVHQHHSRPASPSSHESAGSDGPPSGSQQSMTKDTAEWLARKPSSRRHAPMASLFSSTSPFATANGNGVNQGATNEWQLRRATSHHTDHTDTDTEPTESIISPSTRQSFGQPMFGTTSLEHGYRRTSESAAMSHSSSAISNSSLSPTTTDAFASLSLPRTVPMRVSTPDESTPTPAAGFCERARTPELTSRPADGYDVVVSCTPGEEEVRWEVVVRRVSGGGYMFPPGPLALGGPAEGHGSSQSRAHAPPLASSVNLSLALDVEQPSGKMVFISLPDANSTPTRVRTRSSASPRSVQPLVFHRSTPVPSTAGALAAVCNGVAASSSSPNEDTGISAGVLFPVTESVASVVSPLSPVSPGSPATPALSTVTGSASSSSPRSPPNNKRHGVLDGSSIAPAGPPPPPRRDYRRELGLSPAATPVRTPNGSGGNTPNGLQSPENEAAQEASIYNTSPTPTPPGVVTPTTLRALPLRPSRPPRPSSAASTDNHNGNTAPTPLNVRTAVHAPMASINGGKATGADMRHPLGQGAFGVPSGRLGDGDHFDAMEHIITPDSAKSSFVGFSLEGALGAATQ